MFQSGLTTGLVIDFLAFPPVTQEQLRAYADASGDFNPIHLDEQVAKGAGLPGVIAHGMLIAGLMAERARRFVEENVDLRGSGAFVLEQFQTRFKAMTLLGDTPSVGGVVKEASQDKLVLELQAKNQRGEVSTVGTARFRFADKAGKR
jgi:acyl dehydratase